MLPFSRQDKAVRPAGGVPRGRFPGGGIAVVALALATLGCASAARYAIGPQLPAALPPPRIRIHPMPAQGPALGPSTSLDVRGRVRDVADGDEGLDGFRLRLDGPDGPLEIEATLYAPAVLDAVPGGEVRVRAVPGREGTLRIDDADGPVFYLFDGTVSPPAADLPLTVRPTGRRAYVEVVSGDDLCRWTVLNRALEVVAEGERVATVDPGTTATVDALGRRWSVTAAIASSPDESDCGRKGESRLAFFWARRPAAADRAPR